MDIKTRIHRLIIISFLLALCIPLMTTSAQSDADGSDFIITLALMAVADDRMDGVLTTPDLANIRDMVDEYFANLPYQKMNSELEYRVRAARDALVNTLDAKIAFQKSFDARVNMAFFTALKDGYDTFRKDSNPLESASEYILMDTLSAAGEFKPDSVFLDMLNGILERDYKNTLQKGLDGHIGSTIEGGDQFIAQTSECAYDFSAGLSKEAYQDQLRQLKPVIFINNGVRAVTVSIEYYAPPKDLPLSAPGVNLTVPAGQSVMPGPLPQGNYTFCAHWETDMDTDGDGIKDYDRMVTHTWLSSGHPDDPAAAEEVYVNSVGTATPIGRCDGFKGEAPQSETVMTENFMTESDTSPATGAPEQPTNPDPNADFWDQDDESQDGEDSTPTEEPSPIEEVTPTEEVVPTEEEIPTQPEPVETGLSLTPAELANQGTHSYAMTCQFGDSTESSSFVATWEFSESGANYLEQGLFYTRVSPNVYQTDWPTIITFTSSGYLTSSHYFETNEEGQEVQYPIQCTATFQ